MTKVFRFGGLAFVVVGLAPWMSARPPEGIETMSPAETSMAWIGLTSAGVGVLSSVVSLVATFRR